jgi:predicted DNA-binding protein
MSHVVTFRVDAEMKEALARMAREQDKPVGELLRELVRERVREERRRAFAAEARRQCEILNEAAKDPDSDEAQVMRELEAHLAEDWDEWT